MLTGGDAGAQVPGHDPKKADDQLAKLEKEETDGINSSRSAYLNSFRNCQRKIVETSVNSSYFSQ